MVDSFKINGKQVSEPEFRVVEEALTGACGTPAFAGGDLTEKEAIALLTRGQKSVGASTFLQVCKEHYIYKGPYHDIVSADSILLRNGISVAKRIGRTELAKAVQQNGAVLSHASPKDQHDPELAVLAIHSGGAALVYSLLPWRMQDDPFIAQEALLSSGGKAYLSSALTNNPKIMRTAIAIDPRQFSDAPKDLRQERSIVMDVVSRVGAMLSSAAPQYWEDRTVVFTALQHLEDNKFREFPTLPSKFYADPELMLMAVLNSPEEALLRMKEENSPLLKNETFIATLRQYWRNNDQNLFTLFSVVRGLPFNDIVSLEAQKLFRDHNYFDVTPPTSGDYRMFVDEYEDDNRLRPDPVVQRLGQWLDFAGKPYPVGMFHNHASYRLGIKSMVLFPERFRSLESLLTIWHNGKTIASNEDHRPIALALYTVSDWNGAFTKFNLMDHLVNDGRFRVLYTEVSQDTEAETAIRWASLDGRRPIHTLVLVGHGTKTELQLSYHKRWNERWDIDTSDFKKPFWRSLDHYLTAKGNVLLYACSNGEGGAGADNNANAVASVVPKAVSVQSTSTPSNITVISITPDLKLEVLWVGKSPYSPSGRL